MGRIQSLRMTGITKRFGDVAASDGVDLEVRAGEIVGLLGENGAGKTTLMNILFGLYQPDAGEIRVNDAPVALRSARDAMTAGIGMVHQHFMLVQNHTVAENVALGYRDTPWLFPAREIERRLADFAERYGLAVEPRRRVWELSAGQQQRVEILKALFQGADLLILDEPTSVLTPQEAEELFRILDRMAADGHSVILISHKLEEILRVCTRVVVLRKGRVCGSADPRTSDRGELARLMVGRDVVFDFRKRELPRGEAVLEVAGVSVLSDRGHVAVSDVSLTVHRSEIVGVAGVSGNGQRELVEAITGLRRAVAGQVRIGGRDITNETARVIASLGISHVPEERIKFGIVPNLLIYENAVLKHHRNRLFSRVMFLDYDHIRGHATDIVRDYRVDAPSIDVPMRKLSGGNIQKLILGREIEGDHELLVAAHPTYGLDVGATEYIRGLLLERRERGKAVLLVSEDLEEIFELSDRIAVLFAGRLMGVLDRAQATVEQVGLMMGGVAR
jgi:general nucleoside transport system ATP-binding protein